MVKTALLYDNFCRTRNYVIYGVIIWVQDGNCKIMAQENFSIGAFYNITKNQDNPIKTVGRDSFLSPKTPKIQIFWRSPSPQGSHSPYILGDTTRPRHITSSSSQGFLKWPKQQRHHEDHYSQSKYRQYQSVS